MMDMNRDRRASPRGCGPVRSVSSLCMNYAPAGDPSPSPPGRARPPLVYARARIIRPHQKQLRRCPLARLGSRMPVKVFVDTSPVMEKPLAESRAWLAGSTPTSSAGATALAVPRRLHALDLEPALAPHRPCGSARLPRCLPDDAFPAPFRLDARRCIPTHHRAQRPDPRGSREAIVNRSRLRHASPLPLNRFATRPRQHGFPPPCERAAPRLPFLARTMRLPPCLRGLADQAIGAGE